MDTLKKYKKQIREMFFISVDNDDKFWKQGTIYLDNTGCSNSILNNNCNLGIILSHSKLVIYDKSGDTKTIISTFKNDMSLPSDFKVWWYVRKLKKKIVKQKEDLKSKSEIDNIDECLKKMQTLYPNAIRKQKLNKLG